MNFVVICAQSPLIFCHTLGLGRRGSPGGQKFGPLAITTSPGELSLLPLRSGSCIYSLISLSNHLLQAVESDGCRSWNYSQDDPCKALPTAWLGAGNNRATTVYGYDWLVFGCDEFHFARSINKRYKAILPLVKKSSLTITMTATPITTSIMVR